MTQLHSVDFLNQAATDNITLLTSPPSKSTSSLQAGDSFRNASVTLATQLNRMEEIPILQKPTSPSPRVLTPTVEKIIEPVVHPPRVNVTTPTIIPACNLQNHSKE